MLPNHAPKGKDLLFFFYLRFKGMFFSCGTNGIQHRFMDLSHQAVQSRYFPVSVGLRSQAMKLKFVSHDWTIKAESIINQAKEQANAEAAKITQEGETKLTEVQSNIDANLDDAVNHVVSTVLKA